MQRGGGAGLRLGYKVDPDRGLDQARKQMTAGGFLQHHPHRRTSRNPRKSQNRYMETTNC
jgi:hypothetical protein